MLIIAIAAGFLLLIAFLIIMSVWARRRHELARFEAEQAEAQLDAEKEVQQMQHSRATANLQHPSTELPCPNCKTLVQTTETFCPHCGVMLSASASGLHLQAVPSSPPAPISQTSYMQSSESPRSQLVSYQQWSFLPLMGRWSLTRPYRMVFSNFKAII